MVVLTTAFVRWFYFTQAPHPIVRLSEERFPRLTDRLVIVLVDSVPFDMAFDPKKMPYLAGLRSRATWGEARTEEPTMTGQMVYTIATGARPYLYGVVRNWRQNRMPHETFFDGLGSAGLRIHLYGDMPWVEMFGDRFDRAVVQPEEGRTAAGRPVIWEHAVNELDRWVIPQLDRALTKPDFDVLLWHLHGTDLVMHKYLRDSRLTGDKLRWADLLLEGLVGQLDDGRTTFLLLSDHGCAINGRHGYEDAGARSTFYALFGPKIVRNQRRDILQVDFSPTVSALFGRTPAAPSAGRPLVEGLAISSAERARRLVAAAGNRAHYLKVREKWLPTGVRPNARLLAAGRAAAGAGNYAVASQRATSFLRAAHRADLASRRERRLTVPVLFWIGFLLALGGWAVVLVRSAPQGSLGAAANRSAHLAVAALVIVVTWTVTLLGSWYAGRLFNNHIDMWPPQARLGLWLGVATSIFVSGLAGKAIGLGVFIALLAGWRWVDWYIKAISFYNEQLAKVFIWIPIALIGVTAFDVFRRFFLRIGSTALIELEWHLYSAMFLLLMGYALQLDRHIRIDICYRLFDRRQRALIDVLGDMFFLLPFAILYTFNSIDFAERSWSFWETSDAPGGLGMLFIIKTVLAYSVCILALQGFAELLRKLAYLLKGKEV